MRFPEVSMSGISIWGGETVTFSDAFSNLMNSLNCKVTRRPFTPLSPEAGVVLTT